VRIRTRGGRCASVTVRRANRETHPREPLRHDARDAKGHAGHRQDNGPLCITNRTRSTRAAEAAYATANIQHRTCKGPGGQTQSTHKTNSASAQSEVKTANPPRSRRRVQYHRPRPRERQSRRPLVAPGGGAVFRSQPMPSPRGKRNWPSNPTSAGRLAEVATTTGLTAVDIDLTIGDGARTRAEIEPSRVA